MFSTEKTTRNSIWLVFLDKLFDLLVKPKLYHSWNFQPHTKSFVLNNQHFRKVFQVPCNVLHLVYWICAWILYFWAKSGCMCVVHELTSVKTIIRTFNVLYKQILANQTKPNQTNKMPNNTRIILFVDSCLFKWIVSPAKSEAIDKLTELYNFNGLSICWICIYLETCKMWHRVYIVQQRIYRHVHRTATMLSLIRWGSCSLCKSNVIKSYYIEWHKEHKIWQQICIAMRTAATKRPRVRSHARSLTHMVWTLNIRMNDTERVF